MNWALLLPEGVALGSLIVMIFAELLEKRKNAQRALCWNLSLAAGAFTLAAIVWTATRPGGSVSPMFAVDTLAIFFKGFFMVAGLAVILMSREFFKTRPEETSEFLLILWSSLIALFVLVSARDFILLFIALETFSLSLYALAAYLRRELTSIEAGLKYLILGSLASAFIIYGISMIFVAAGTTQLDAVRELFTTNPGNRLVLFGILLIVSGLGFKIASVPFQLWVPDVYEGAPTPVVAYLSVASKAAGFAFLLRVLYDAFPAFADKRLFLFSALSAMTILYGNLGALVQTNLKRLMGYSSIGHAGYLLMGLAAGKTLGVSAVIFYLMAYAFANLGAFLVITIASSQIGSDQIQAYRGLARRSPFLAAALFIAFLSLAGVPPLAGFFGKFLVLLAAVKSGIAWLALLGSLAVAISLYYYLSVVRVVYFEAPADPAPLQVPCAIKVALVLSITLILIAGFWQAPFLKVAEHVAASLV